MRDLEALLRRLDHPGKVERIGHDMAVLCEDAASTLRELQATINSEEERAMSDKKHLYRINRRRVSDGSTETIDIHGTSMTIAEHHVTVHDEGVVFSVHVDHVIDVSDITPADKDDDLDSEVWKADP
jgi:hypothetical protein